MTETPTSAGAGTGIAPILPVPDLFAYLHGSWDCERELADRLGGVRGTYTGTADFSYADRPTGPAEGVLVHAEQGEMKWNGSVYPTSRTLLIHPGDAPGTAAVTFEDGRPFHILDLRSGEWTAEHPCAEDHYTGRFRILDRDHWLLVWAVTGPAKDTLMTSRYTRRGGPRPTPDGLV
ncbi:DUF6314 family protein [Phaeacidiphilus oryzae]|uniref:DUF6314 family protein n=1 Tax=Phaeacidiphilus oryzae TaxID=348818 RepID=UPI000567EE3F|nr:DUF6314 family protein [Phaeacidiphilus oryzae]